MLQKILSLLYFFLIVTGETFAAPEKRELPTSKESFDKIIDVYTKTHQQFSRQVCSSGAEQKFNKLNHAFRGDGHFIPMTLEDKLDRQVIVKNLPELRKKLVWIDGVIEKLREVKQFDSLINDLKALEKQFLEILEFKHKHYLAKTDQEKRKVEISSKYELVRFRQKLKEFYQGIFFLQSFNHPIDHFALRKEYDQWKSATNEEEKNKANDVYFYRQIVQDGAQDPDHRRSDRFLRSLMDTVILALDSMTSDLMEEDIRYDLDTFFSMVEIQLQRGVNNQLRRLEEWRERTHRAIVFYTALMNNKVVTGAEEQSVDQLVGDLARARYALREYNFERQAEVYHFWRDQSELMQALFSIETILYNEVGTVDGKDGIERRDVTQIVLNRFRHPFYSELAKDDGLFRFLKLSEEVVARYPWLNLLFKDGEFSFTYFFIPSSVRVYCPDMSRAGRWLRRQNLKIALELLHQPAWEFQALRYYSRHSMHGRIRMDQLWDRYQPIEERPGPLLKDQLGPRKLRSKGEYRFLYHFVSPQGERFQVLEMGRDIVVFAEKSELYYEWRNPQLFKYFRPF